MGYAAYFTKVRMKGDKAERERAFAFMRAEQYTRRPRSSSRESRLLR
jgi:hypothetical protein